MLKEKKEIRIDSRGTIFSSFSGPTPQAIKIMKEYGIDISSHKTKSLSKDLIDEAFLRRLGYKIPFIGLNKEQFKEIWSQECEKNEVLCDSVQFEYLVEQLLLANKKEFLPCYPRDLLAIIHDQIAFKNLKPEIDQALLDFAWQSYFV